MYPVTYTNQFSPVNISRPNNVTAYAVSGQSINDNTPILFTFPVCVSRRGAYLTRSQLVTNNSAHTGAIRLHLFASPVSIVADQASLSGITFANGQGYEGYVDFTNWIALGGFAASEGSLISRPMQVQTSGDNNIYGVLEARAAFTPIANQQFSIQVYTEYSA